MRIQWTKPEEIKPLQSTRLRLLRHAYKNIPDYRRRRTEAGVTVDAIRSDRELPASTRTDTVNLFRHTFGEGIHLEFEVGELLLHPKFRAVTNEIPA